MLRALTALAARLHLRPSCSSHPDRASYPGTSPNCRHRVSAALRTLISAALRTLTVGFPMRVRGQRPCYKLC